MSSEERPMLEDDEDVMSLCDDKEIMDIDEELKTWDITTADGHAKRYSDFINNPEKRRMLDEIIEECFNAFGKEHDDYYLIKNNKVTLGEYVEITTAAGDLFMTESTLLEIEAPIVICGDIHGQFHDLLRIFLTEGLPNDNISNKQRYLFLGDYVDRGPQSLEVVLLLFCLKVRYPNDFFLLRGNHEYNGINGRQKRTWFYGECVATLGDKANPIFSHTNAIFNCLPVAAIVADRIFCVHGGISPFLTNMNQIRNIKRPCAVPPGGLMEDLLWSDPSRSPNQTDWSVNLRGCSVCYGEKAVNRFLERFDLDFICRAHEVPYEGYEFFFNRKVLNIFSAPMYCMQRENKGAVLKVASDLRCSIQTFVALVEDTRNLEQYKCVVNKTTRLYSEHYKPKEAQKPQDLWDGGAFLWVLNYVDSLMNE
ncbi:hypothetical protein QR680_011912 [Steinernema hermaphroditum]|uniref:Serine/threonine-protein phosphatase n=1 Tax=Steinernema hermaphroditum TaxID=289476 RepID=A0AA39I063_9BILA|nr:hypothetical protein QR680_011912 [Steinernema hermaphroditum]